MIELLYRAENGEGRVIQGSVVATDVADARFQLTRMGMRKIEILSSMSVPTKLVSGENPHIAALAVQSQFDSLPRALLRIFTNNWLTWLPLAGLAAWTLVSGPPFSTGDYLIFAGFALGILWVLFVSMPLILYQQILWARVFGRYRRGLVYFAILRRLNVASGLPAIAMGVERCKLLAKLGQVDQAKREFAVLASDATPKQRLIHALGLAGAMHDREEMMRIQRELAALEPDNPEMKVDLAMSIARYTDNIEEAQALISGVHPNSLPEHCIAGLTYVRGLIAQAHGDHVAATRDLTKATQGFRMTTNAIAFLISCEILAYLAISLKALGREEEARKIWDSAWPVLKHHGSDRIRMRFETGTRTERVM